MSSPSTAPPNAQSQQDLRLFCYSCGQTHPMGPSGTLQCAACQSDFVEIIEHDEQLQDADHTIPDGPETAHARTWTPFGMFTISSPTVFPVAGGGAFTRRQYTGNGVSFTTASFSTGNDHEQNAEREREHERHEEPPRPQEQQGQQERRGAEQPPGFGGFPFQFAPMPPFSGDNGENTGFMGLSDILQDLFAPRRDSRRESQASQPQEHVGANAQGAETTDEEPLRPRDTEQPQARVPRIMTLEQFLASMAPGAAPPFGEDLTPEEREQQQGQQEQQQPPPPTGAASLFALFRLMSGISGGRVGDMVFSEEELQRILQQLAENAEPGGPLPATEDAINALPKKKVDQGMLGDDGKLECSICIENLEVDEEVTVLPCHHLFHEECIKAWLREHDSCPHCRKPITPPEQRDQQHRRRTPNADANANGTENGNGNGNGNAGNRENAGVPPGFANMGFFPFPFFGPPPPAQRNDPEQPHQTQEPPRPEHTTGGAPPPEPHTHAPHPPNAATSSHPISFGPITGWVSTTTFPSFPSQPMGSSSTGASAEHPETGGPQANNAPPFGGHPLFRNGPNVFASTGPNSGIGLRVTQAPGQGEGGGDYHHHHHHHHAEQGQEQRGQRQEQGQGQGREQEERGRQPSFFETISTFALPPLQALMNQANLFGTQSSSQQQQQQQPEQRQYRSREREEGRERERERGGGAGGGAGGQRHSATFFGIPMGPFRSASPGRREEIRRQQQEQRYRQINEDDFDQPD